MDELRHRGDSVRQHDLTPVLLGRGQEFALHESLVRPQVGERVVVLRPPAFVKRVPGGPVRGQEIGQAALLDLVLVYGHLSAGHLFAQFAEHALALFADAVVLDLGSVPGLLQPAALGF